MEFSIVDWIAIVTSYIVWDQWKCLKQGLKEKNALLLDALGYIEELKETVELLEEEKRGAVIHKDIRVIPERRCFHC
jgi:hypothetical protein